MVRYDALSRRSDVKGTAKADETKTRRRIVKLLKTEGAMDSASLAGHLDVTAMAVRQHLYALQEEKLVAAEERPVPLGRPAKFWRLRRRRNASFRTRMPS